VTPAVTAASASTATSWMESNTISTMPKRDDSTKNNDADGGKAEMMSPSGMNQSNNRNRRSSSLFPNTSPAAANAVAAVNDAPAQPSPQQKTMNPKPNRVNSLTKNNEADGVKAERMSPVNQSNNRRRSNSFFTHTSPAVAASANSVAAADDTAAQPAPQQKITNPFEHKNSTNPFDSPARIKLHTNPFDSPTIRRERTEDDPFEEQSSPIHVERSSEDSSSRYEVNDDDVSMKKPFSVEDSAALPNDERVVTSIVPSTSLASRRGNDSGRPTTPQASLQPPSKSLPTLQALLLPPSKRDTLLRAGRTSPSTTPSRKAPIAKTKKAGPAATYTKVRNLDDIRASISQLKHNGVGGVGKSTSTLVRNEETGRYIIRDVDDEGFDDIINADDDDDDDGRMVMTRHGHQRHRCCPKVIDEEEEEEESSDEEYEDPSTPTTSSNDAIIKTDPSTKDNRNETQQTPIKFMMTNQIMSESILDDDAVEDAVRAATECLSVTSSTTTATNEILSMDDDVQEAHVSAQRQRVVKTKEYDAAPFSIAEDGDDEFSVIRRPPRGGSTGQGLWNESKWSAFESSSSSTAVVCDTNKDDDFDTFCPSKSMDDWGFTYNDDSDSDSFAPGPQWDADDDSDDSCWGGNNEEKVNDFPSSSLQPSPISVVVSKRKLFSSRRGGG